MANQSMIKNSKFEEDLKNRLRMQDNLKKFKDSKSKPIHEILTPDLLRLLRDLELRKNDSG